MAKKFFLTAFIWVFFAASTLTQQFCPLTTKTKPKEVANLSVFSHLAILHEGRVKPLDTFASNLLLQFSGDTTVNRKPAIRWFARFLFAPETVLSDKIFLINHPDIPGALNMEPEPHRRYSFEQIEPGLAKLQELAVKANAIDSKSRTIVEQEILRLDNNVRLFIGLARSFDFVFPHPDFGINDARVKELLELPADQNQFSFLDIAMRANLIQTATQDLEQKDQNEWTKQQRIVMQLLSNLYQWSQFYQGIPLAIVPAMDTASEEWLSPWEAIIENFQQEKGRNEVIDLSDMVKAYYAGRQVDFDLSARAFADSILSRSDGKLARKLDGLSLEVLYNRWNLFLAAKIFYLLAFFSLLFSLLFPRGRLEKLGLVLTVVGFIPHAIGLFLRVIILNRPPVSSLYETFIFVGFVTCLLGLILERIHKKGLGVVVASVSGFIFLTIAGKYAAEGDTLRMLVAVLNSNFWLSTHVLSITTGYGGVCVAGILGHVYILQAMSKKGPQVLEDTYRHILGVLGFGLTMTFLGTNLGGIWADQSWGRFWGWDPKENGALLIVLWCTILFHARVGEMIGPLEMAVGTVIGIIVVMWAWFGVNLLNVGLHSYGFTAGVAGTLILYVVCQIAFLVICVPMARKNLKHYSS